MNFSLQQLQLKPFLCVIVCSVCVLFNLFGASQPSLIERNPFAAVTLKKTEEKDNFATLTSEELSNVLEFCGSHSIGGVRRFSLLSKSENKRYWLELTQSIQGYKLFKYSEEKRALLLKKNDKLEVLQIRERNKPASRKRYAESPKRPTYQRVLPNRANKGPSAPRRRHVIPRDSKPRKTIPPVPKPLENVRTVQPKGQRV